MVRRQSGVVSRRQALDHLTERMIHRRIASGRWQVGDAGVYVLHNGPLSERQQLWVASLSVGAGRPAILGGLTALILNGLRRFTSPYIEVVLGHRRRNRRPPPGVRVHRTTRLERPDLRLTRPLSTAPARSAVDAARWARTDAEARTIIATCFQQRLVVGDEVERVVAAMPVARRRALILATAADARGGSHTLTELDLVALCRRSGLPTPTRQATRTDSSGRQRYLDAVWEEWGVRAEIDGAHHMDAEQWWTDMRRHNDLARRGEVALRFPAWLVRDSPAEVVVALRRALEDAGWQPGNGAYRKR